MKKLVHKPGEVRGLSAPYQHQLSAYALAAAAAGVSVVALSQPSEAKIIYTGAHEVIAIGDSYALDLNGDGKTDLTIAAQYHRLCTTDGTCFHSETLYARMAGRNQAVYNVFGAVAMKPGMRIGPKKALRGGTEAMAGLSSLSSSYGVRGSWINVRKRYLGVQFKINGEIHYGWARLNVKVQLHPSTIVATLTGYAYETVPDKPITAGKTSGAEENASSKAPDPAVLPTPSARPTLGTLALGTSALSFGRHKTPNNRNREELLRANISPRF